MFSEILKDLRLEKKYTQSDVAKACNVSTQCISSLEIGSRNPTGSTISALADFFGVSADYLLGRSDELGYVTVNNKEIPLSQEEKKLLDNFRAMRPDIQAYCLSMTETLSQTPESLAGKSSKKSAEDY